MAARALGGARRVVIAAALMAVVLVALLGAWFATGWHDVRAQETAIEDAPVVAASARAGELARELRGELDQLVEREAARPYFHYQNLFHDPRAGGEGVTPSPLASGPADPLILGYFQIDQHAQVTTPSLNDQFPQLSETVHLVEHRAFREAVAQHLAQVLAPPHGTLIVAVEPKPQPVHHPRPPIVVPPPGAGGAANVTGAIDPTNATQTFQIDTSAYVQNTNANAVYSRQSNVANETVVTPGAGVSSAEVAAPPIAPPPPKPIPPRPPPAKPPAPITITVSSLEWHTLPFSGGTSLVAVREVQTPDGNLAQGFVVDRAALTSWLANHAGDLVAQLHPRAANTSAPSAELVPGWELTIEPNPRELATSVTDAAKVATTFVVRFVIVGAIALLAALLVVWLVARAERYARERSQFAAAAAHELRTPLAGLQLYGDMLADGLGDPTKLRDYARRMSEEASRLGRVVSNVLGFSQLERGNLSIDPKLGNVADALRELAEHVQPAFDRAGVAIDLDVPPTLDARFDRDALARIVGNLLDNAEKYTRDAEDRTIRLSAQRVGDRVEITVRDHGAGIANPAKLFQVFARGVATDGPAGLGLGLALSRSLAEAMGGELVFRVPEGRGAMFVVALAMTT
ncbi:MAG: HAMP domain-containing sensor histidine kinase [Kofleriaceae bacterium]